jgi:hypothetical protein
LFGIDGLWWFNDGKYAEYYEAFNRAHKLIAQGHRMTIQFIRKEVFDVLNTIEVQQTPQNEG